MPRREPNASLLIRYLFSTAFLSHQGRRLLLVTVATARSPSQFRYCADFCSLSRDAAVRTDSDRPRILCSFIAALNPERTREDTRMKEVCLGASG